MIILGSGTKKGDDIYNRDISNHMDGFCYVIDGATPLFNDNLFSNTSDVYEYMKWLKNNITNKSSIEGNFIDAIKKSNLKISNIEKYSEYELPTFTIAAVKEENKKYFLYVLCDSLISILYKNGEIKNIYDNRFEKFKKRWANKIEKIDKLVISEDDKTNMKLSIWKEYRKYANKKSGYPVGSTDFNSIKSGISLDVLKEDVDSILICTDGFFNAFGFPSEKWYFNKDVLASKIKSINYLDDITYILLK